MSLNILEAIERKRAVRDYLDQPIPYEITQQVLEVGRRSQSSRNTQPWHFIPVCGRNLLGNLAKTGDFANHFATTALCIVIALPDPASKVSYLFDAGHAAAYLQLAAMKFGIGSCVVKLHHSEVARELLDIPAGLQVIYAIAFGYPTDSAAVLTPTRQKGRKPLDEMVH